MMSAVTAGGKDLGDRKDEDDHRRDHLQWTLTHFHFLGELCSRQN